MPNTPPRAIALHHDDAWHEYPSIAEASRQTGIARRTLSSRLNRYCDASIRYAGETDQDVEVRRLAAAAGNAARNARRNARRAELRQLERQAAGVEARRVSLPEAMRALAGELGCGVAEVYR